ncbi:hypothetical protein EPN28_01495 [Patescibacteria group bacterium]|nr:MAG: hypothetical protein EPN28_01495 [Patescibacteria group bacterium]
MRLINLYFFLALLLAVFLSPVIPAQAESPFGTDDEQAGQAKKNVQEKETKSSERALPSVLPNCAKTGDLSASSPCRDVSIFVELGINIARYLFSIIGALALLMFVYGGFMLILSAGSAERVKKGGEIMLAAMVGLLISFTAYMLVRFLGGAVGLGSEFKLK